MSPDPQRTRHHPHTRHGPFRPSTPFTFPHASTVPLPRPDTSVRHDRWSGPPPLWPRSCHSIGPVSIIAFSVANLRLSLPFASGPDGRVAVGVHMEVLEQAPSVPAPSTQNMQTSLKNCLKKRSFGIRDPGLHLLAAFLASSSAASFCIRFWSEHNDTHDPDVAAAETRSATSKMRPGGRRRDAHSELPVQPV